MADNPTLLSLEAVHTALTHYQSIEKQDEKSKYPKSDYIHITIAGLELAEHQLHKFSKIANFIIE